MNKARHSRAGSLSTSTQKDTWSGLFTNSCNHELYHKIRAAQTPSSDWSDWSPQKVDDFVKAVVASCQLLDNGQPFSTLETGVFAGGTSAVFLHALKGASRGSCMHVGIDPYFTLEQSYSEYKEDYGLDAYLIALSELSKCAYELKIPYVPYLMSSQTFIHKDLLPRSYDFRVIHLDGDHSNEAVFSELKYFTSKVTTEAVFIMDDIGEGFPGVLEGIEQFQQGQRGLTELQRFSYETRGGNIGFGVYLFSLKDK